MQVYNKRSAMGYTNFEYSVSSRRHSTSPLTAELTCTEVCRKQIRLFTDEIKLLYLPEQTIVHHSSQFAWTNPTPPQTLETTSSSTSLVVPTKLPFSPDQARQLIISLAKLRQNLRYHAQLLRHGTRLPHYLARDRHGYYIIIIVIKRDRSDWSQDMEDQAWGL